MVRSFQVSATIDARDPLRLTGGQQAIEETGSGLCLFGHQGTQERGGPHRWPSTADEAR